MALIYREQRAATFTINNVQPGDMGTYDVMISGMSGYYCSSALSAPAVLTVNLPGEITLSSAQGTDNQILCRNTALTNITYQVGGGATGVAISPASLPSGLTSSYNSGVFTISGTPSVAGTFNYTVTTTGSVCGNPSLTGSITVQDDGTITLASGNENPTRCLDTELTDIVYTIGGNATGASITTGSLPPGVSGGFSGGSFRISGTPTSSGTYNYTVTTSGSTCVNPYRSGTITVTAEATLINTSGAPSQAVCNTSPIATIRFTMGGTATGITFSGNLPAGVTGNYNAGVYTISGTPNESGTFSYTVTASGPCNSPSISGTITVIPRSQAGTVTPSIQVLCQDGTPQTLTVNGVTGTVTRWQISTTSGATWQDIPGSSGSTYTPSTNLNAMYRAVVQDANGICPPVYSASAMVSFIPPDPPIVTVQPDNEICLGETVTMTASNNILYGPYMDGSFNQANPPGWCVNNCSTIFPAQADNRVSNVWSETNGPKDFFGIIYDTWDNTKFAIVNGDLSSTLETPVFSLVGLTTAQLTWRQALRLQSGASATIELSLDGGNTYNIVLAQWTGPANVGTTAPLSPATPISLSQYLTQSNLMIRFSFTGVGSSVWAIEDVMIPQGPNPEIIYTWWPTTNMTPSNGIGQTVTVQPDGTTTYTVNASYNGCVLGTSAPTTITVHPLPVCSITGNTTMVCPSSVNTYDAPTGMASYLWTISGGGTITAGGNTQQVTVTAGATCNSSFTLNTDNNRRLRMYQHLQSDHTSQ